MKARTLLVPVALCTLLPVTLRAAPPDPSAKPPPAKVALPPKPAAPPPAAAAPKPAPASAAPSSKPAAGTPVLQVMPAKPAAKLPPAKTPVEAALYGVVRLERAGRPIGIGTSLSGDGRILTALSPLTHGNQIDARYPEGQLVRVKLSYSDRAWDLALLTPEGDARHPGLRASHDPTPSAGSKLHAVGYANGKLSTSDLTIKAKSTLRGGDSAELSDALELAASPRAIDIGAPLVNDQGEVVAVLARACAASDKSDCTMLPYAAPMSAIRGFLRSVPLRRGPWLGLEVVAFDAGIARGVRVAALAPEGPASNAGLRAGPPGIADVVLAVDGTPVSTAEAFSDAVESHARGLPVRLLLLSEGRYREVGVSALEDADGGAPAHQEQILQSNPARPWPHPQSVPNPYR